MNVNGLLSMPHPWQIPWDAVVFLLSLLDPTLQATVGEGVALVELKVTLTHQ